MLAVPGIARTVNIDHIKRGYYSMKALNPNGIVPVGPDLPFAPPAAQRPARSFLAVASMADPVEQRTVEPPQRPWPPANRPAVANRSYRAAVHLLGQADPG